MAALRMAAVVLAAGAVLSACGTESGPELQLYVMYPAEGLGDRSFADAVYAGVVEAGLAVEFTASAASPDDATAAADTFRGWTATPAAGTELIITVGFTYADTVNAAQCAFGDRFVLHLDSALRACPRLRSVTYRTFAPAFLAGVAAMTVSSRHQAAVVGGMDVETVNEFIRGFAAGVSAAGGELLPVQYLSDDVDGFWNATKAHDVAVELYADADVVFPVAGGSGAGVFEAAREAAGRFVIGVDGDQSWMGRGIVIGSVVKKLDATVMQTIKDVASGEFSAGADSLGLEEGGVDFVINDVFAASVSAAVDAARAAALAAGIADRQEHP